MRADSPEVPTKKFEFLLMELFEKKCCVAMETLLSPAKPILFTLKLLIVRQHWQQAPLQMEQSII